MMNGATRGTNIYKYIHYCAVALILVDIARTPVIIGRGGQGTGILRFVRTDIGGGVALILVDISRTPVIIGRGGQGTGILRFVRTDIGGGRAWSFRGNQTNVECLIVNFYGNIIPLDRYLEFKTKSLVVYQDQLIMCEINF